MEDHGAKTESTEIPGLHLNKNKMTGNNKLTVSCHIMKVNEYNLFHTGLREITARRYEQRKCRIFIFQKVVTDVLVGL